MARICLVRHGQTDWNLKSLMQGQIDIPLNETGRIQAGQSAEYLSNQDWDVVVSSTLDRANETARIIVDRVGIATVEVDMRLIERAYGAGEGKSYTEMREVIENGTVFGMESDEELIERSYGAFAEIVQKHKDKNIIIVSHAETIKAILSGIDPATDYLSLFLDNACANFIEVIDGKCVVKEVNVSGHILV